MSRSLDKHFDVHSIDFPASRSPSSIQKAGLDDLSESAALIEGSLTNFNYGFNFHGYATSPSRLLISEASLEISSIPSRNYVERTFVVTQSQNILSVRVSAYNLC